jgi:hypothetical protein
LTAAEDAGARVARRSGVTRQIDRATRALDAGAYGMALTHLRLLRALGGAQSATRLSTGAAIGRNAHDRTRPDARAPGLAAAGIAVAQAGATDAKPNVSAAVPDARHGRAAGLHAMMDGAPSATVSPAKPGGGGWKLVMVAPPSRLSGAEFQAAMAAGARAPSTRDGTVHAGVLAGAPGMDVRRRISAGDFRAGKTGLASAGAVMAPTDPDTGHALPHDAMRSAGRAGMGFARLATQAGRSLAPAGVLPRPPPIRPPVRPVPMAPSARNRNPDAGGVAGEASADGGGASALANPGFSGVAGPADSGGDAGSAAVPNPTMGDVYLDGTLMGRWMARSLAAEAARPASGSAAFDPRRNAFPTGAMIGG